MQSIGDNLPCREDGDWYIPISLDVRKTHRKMLKTSNLPYTRLLVQGPISQEKKKGFLIAHWPC